jgi:nucleotide-binding universal stress UspA family protein
MQKIIAAFDGFNLSQSTLNYAIALTAKANAHLTAVFLDDKTYTRYAIYDLVFQDGVSEEKKATLEQQDVAIRIEAAQKVVTACSQTGISFNVHHDEQNALDELLHETIFADLLIVNSAESFTHYEEKYPSRFLQDLLSNTQTPVFLTPETYKPIEKIVLLFDGTPTSTYAIKQLNYLLPIFNYLPVELITVRNEETQLFIPDSELLKEFLQRHYPVISYTVLNGTASVEIVEHLQKEPLHCLIVLGAYRRSMLSRWFKSSMADALVKAFNFPLFIAHNK